MTSPAVRRRTRRRAAWAVPAATAVAVAATGVASVSAFGTSSPKLAPRTAAQLLVEVQRSQTQALSGTVVQTARLGLPALPGADSSASLSWQSLVAGSHSARVWVDGPQRQRVALLGSLAESDLVHSGHDVWIYTSQTNEATHAVLPAEPAHPAAGKAPAGDARDLTPDAAARQALASIAPTTAVSVDGSAVVAGRPVYTLRLEPRDARSTIRRVLVAVDSATSVPLRVQVYGSADKPAFETAFTDVSFRTPPASVFAFSPPQGAAVTERTVPAHPAGTGTGRPTHQPAAGTTPTVVGTGWTSILVARMPAASDASGLATLSRLTTALPNGDRLLRSSLVNALLTSDGRVLVGAVSPQLLQDAAARPTG